MAAVLKELSGGQTPSRVICCGHSLGGALATLGLTLLITAVRHLNQPPVPLPFGGEPHLDLCCAVLCCAVPCRPCCATASADQIECMLLLLLLCACHYYK